MKYYQSELRDKTVLYVLDQVIAAHQIPRTLYSLDGYAEDRVCLEKKPGEWCVYTGIRGRMCEEESYDSVVEACQRMIEKITDDYEEEQSMKLSFSGELQKFLHPQNFDAIDAGKASIPKIV